MVDIYHDVIGHRAVVELLRGDGSRPAHAYLFVGPVGVGKATVAKRFAAALIGEGDDNVERRVVGGAHPDLMVIEPEGTASITVDQSRRITSTSSLAPLEADRKVFLFEEAGLMNDEAANALLKTIEEPTESTIFILVSESEHDFPETVASRCRTVVFGRVDDADIRASLSQMALADEQVDDLTRIASGRPGLAMALATRPAVANFRSTWLQVPQHLSEHPGHAFVLADQVYSAAEPLIETIHDRQADELARFEQEGGSGKALKDRHARELKRATTALHVTGLETLAGFYRDAAAAQLGAPTRNPDIPVAELTKVLPRIAVANVERVLEAIEAIESNQRPKLAFAALFSDLGGR
jgi:DNA polymerase-3 subunit delta'